MVWEVAHRDDLQLREALGAVHRSILKLPTTKLREQLPEDRPLERW